MHFIGDFVRVCMWLCMGACVFYVYSRGYIIEVGFLLINLCLLFLLVYPGVSVISN
jgi:hypothetical protein